MNRKITGFHTDFENHWVAELECGHCQHMRHDPPWIERPWVMPQEGRNSRVLWRIADSSKTFRYFRDMPKNKERF
jgi:hypothetical protein